MIEQVSLNGWQGEIPRRTVHCGIAQMCSVHLRRCMTAFLTRRTEIFLSFFWGEGKEGETNRQEKTRPQRAAFRLDRKNLVHRGIPGNAARILRKKYS
ncbi:hypothetical protein, partial [Ralstonia mannitolilytica]|uniref:hypothetical protein n=1 Tax=Ralstonia mannitolilytica TaxID=105219 RepID=UPI003B841C4D